MQNNQITETLSPEHEYRADDWDHHYRLSDATQDKIHRAMNGGHHVVLPIQSNSDVNDIDPDVHNHLKEHGWEVENYKQGLAKKKQLVGDPSRGIPYREKEVTKNIGKILHETGAPDDVKHAFANDPHRNMATKGSVNDYRALISTHPYAIAHMSTNTPWESCMSMDTGSNCHYLSADSEHGTHVAYLVHKDDKGVKTGVPENPLARIALKRFDTGEHGYDHNDEDNDTVFRPESSTYGSPVHGFEDTVKRWAHQAYPAKKGEEYTKHDDLYDNDGEHTFTEYTKDQLTHGVKTLNLPRNVAYDQSDVKHIIKTADEMSDSHGGHSDVYSHVLNSLRESDIPAHETDRLVNRMIDTSNPETSKNPGQELKNRRDVYHIMSKHGGKLSGKTIMKSIQSGIFESPKHLPTSIIGSPKLPQEIANGIQTNQIDSLHPSKITPHHVERVISAYENGESGSAYPIRSLLAKDMIDKKGFDRIFARDVHKSDTSGVETLVRNKHFDKSNHEWGMNHGYVAHKIVAHSPYVEEGDIEKASRKLASFNSQPYPHLKSTVLQSVLRNKHVSGDIIRHAATQYMDLVDSNHATPSQMLIPEGNGHHLTDEHVKRMIDYHYNHDNAYGYSNINDRNLSNRMLDEHDKRAKSAIHEHESAMHSGENEDEATEKAIRALTVHHEFLDDRYDNLFGDHEEHALRHDKDYQKHAESAYHAHRNNSIGFDYDGRHYQHMDD